MNSTCGLDLMQQNMNFYEYTNLGRVGEIFEFLNPSF